MTSDFGYALRGMARNRGITAIAALALALGIGANTAIFSVVNAVLVRPLPFPNSERLVWIWETNPSRNLPFAFMHYATFAEWRGQCRAFESVSAYSPGSANLTAGGEPERVTILRVNASFFAMVGVRPLLGRGFLPEEDRPGAGQVAVIDHGLWQRRFGSDKGIVGRPVVLDDQPYTVVGVLPPGFEFPSRASDVYVPIARSTARGGEPVPVGAYARLKPGVSIAAAQSEMDRFYRQHTERFPRLKGWTARVWGVREFLVRNVQLTLVVLLGAVALVLLIACANVANLLLARAGARRREIAMRVALGAGRGRLMRQLMTESMALAVAGGLLGLPLAFGGVHLFRLLGPAQFPMLAQARIDGSVLAFTMAVSLATGLIFGIAPALSGVRTPVYENLKEGGRSGESLRRNRARSVLVVTEMAIALLLMSGASLMIRSLLRLQNAQPGFNPAGVLTVSLNLPAAKYPKPEQRVAFYRDLLERVRALSGVKTAGMTNLLPLGGANTGVGLIAEGQPPPRPGEIPILYHRSVDPLYFQAMQIPLKRGRFFTEQDRSELRVAIVNEEMARRFWPNQDPVGRRFGDGRNWTTVIGVVAGVRHTSLAQEPEPEFYDPYPQAPRPAMHLVVRTAADPLRLAPALRRAVRDSDKDLPLSRIGSMNELVENSISSRRFSVILLGIFAAVALALAAVGIYGVIAFSVTRRTQEIGVRMALGAQAGNVLRMVVGQALALAAAGAVIGIAAGVALSRVIRSLLYDTSPTDPLTLAAVTLVLLAIAALAGYIPARRAARVDPTVALRYE